MFSCVFPGVWPDDAQVARSLGAFDRCVEAIDALRSRKIAPEIVGGRGVGEYVALVAAGVLGPQVARAIVLARAAALREVATANPGSMAVMTEMEDQDAEWVCRRAGGDVFVAAHDAPGRVVIAGRETSVAVAAELALDLGRRQRRIHCGAALNTPLMSAARARLASALRGVDFRQPTVRFVSSVDGRLHTDPDEIRMLLDAEIVSTVRWRETLSLMHDSGAEAVFPISGANDAQLVYEFAMRGRANATDVVASRRDRTYANGLISWLAPL